MATSPQTWSVLQGVQYRVQSEVLVNSASPFAAWITTANNANPNQISDFARFSPNPYGTITNAIYIGAPKDFTSNYKVQCTLFPLSENVERHAHGGKVWDELMVHAVCWFWYRDDWLATMQTACNVRDAFQVVAQKHAGLPNVPIVRAVKTLPSGKAPTGFYFDEAIGRDWLCWGLQWWYCSEWFSPGGFVE